MKALIKEFGEPFLVGLIVLAFISLVLWNIDDNAQDRADLEVQCSAKGGEVVRIKGTGIVCVKFL